MTATFAFEGNKEVLDNRPGSKTQTTEGMKSGREGGGELVDGWVRGGVGEEWKLLRLTALHLRWIVI